MHAAKEKVSYFANRGSSGIDGSLSTAVGSAIVSEKEHLFISGDLSFVYDSNGLWNRNFPYNLKIIVLNDKGGGIFRLLDGPDKMSFFETFSVTSHPVSIRHLAEAFGLNYLFAGDADSLRLSLEEFVGDAEGPCVLEIDTSKRENSRIFKELYKSLQNE